jgi:hypothetical protein
MKYVILFTLLAATLGAAASAGLGFAPLLFWACLSFGLFGTAYAANRPSLLGKQLDGQQAFWATIFLLPYFITTWVL